MIRPLTLLTALLAAGSGAYLFAVKHRAQVLDDQLASVTEQSREDGQRIRVLQAQWALEIDPTRLGQLATQFTTLQPMKPAQLVTLTGLGQALPAPGSAAPGQNPEGAIPDVSGADPFSTVIAANGLPLPPPPRPAPDGAVAAPVALASAAALAAPVAAPAHVVAVDVAAPARPAAHLVRLAMVRRTARQTAIRLAQNVAAPGYTGDKELATPAPADVKMDTVQAPIYASARASVTPAPLYVSARTASPMPVYGGYRPYSPPPPPPLGAEVVAIKTSSAPLPAETGGSMLGMATTIAPPQPFGAGN